jgi:hypothetical protein
MRAKRCAFQSAVAWSMRSFELETKFHHRWPLAVEARAPEQHPVVCLQLAQELE